MKILLDENFPLALLHRLQSLGHEAQHIIPLSLRGAPDSTILQILRNDRYLFLTQDEDFFKLKGSGTSVILWSRVPQRLPLDDRVARWINAIETYFDKFSGSRFTLYEIAPTGEIVPWKKK